MSRNVDIRLNAFFDVSEIPIEFKLDVIECAKMFTNYQEDAILRNLYLYNSSDEEINSYEVKKKISKKFIDVYKLQKIRPSEFIAPARMMQLAAKRKVLVFSSYSSNCPI